MPISIYNEQTKQIILEAIEKNLKTEIKVTITSIVNGDLITSLSDTFVGYIKEILKDNSRFFIRFIEKESFLLNPSIETESIISFDVIENIKIIN